MNASQQPRVWVEIKQNYVIERVDEAAADSEHQAADKAHDEEPPEAVFWIRGFI